MMVQAPWWPCAIYDVLRCFNSKIEDDREISIDSCVRYQPLPSFFVLHGMLLRIARRR